MDSMIRFQIIQISDLIDEWITDLETDSLQRNATYQKSWPESAEFLIRLPYRNTE